MNKSIVLIGFGGTIAMVPNREGALVPARSAEELVEQAPGLRELGCELDVVQLLNKDSSNLTPSDWRLLIAKIAELYDKYDGIIVTHGTDTMPYTAAAVAFALGRALAKPIVFTGAQLPMTDPGTDARVNLERSMKVVIEAIRQSIGEVMIVFADEVLRATRAIKTSEARFDAFDSPAFPHLADITATETVFSAVVRHPMIYQRKHLIPRDQFETGIASIDVRPGLEPAIVRALTSSDKCRALILKSLGAGNIPSDGIYSLLPVVEELVSSGKAVIIATKFVGGRTVPDIYEPGREALKAGAGHAGNMTDVAAEVKLMWLLGRGVTEPEKVKAAMLKSYVGEID